jgi:hypothetical protein
MPINVNRIVVSIPSRSPTVLQALVPDIPHVSGSYQSWPCRVDVVGGVVSGIGVAVAIGGVAEEVVGVLEPDHAAADRRGGHDDLLWRRLLTAGTDG